MEKFFEERKETMAKFIVAHEISKRLRKVKVYDEEADYSTPIDHEISRPDPCDQNLAPGQIRVLPGTERITYIALIRRWGCDAYLIMPFSNYRFPATEYEFLTEYNGGVWQRVLQVWNARTLQNETLQKSWVAGILPQIDLDDAWHLWEKSLGGREVEDRLLKKTALSIYRLADPRLEYKREELKNFARVDAEDFQLVDAPAWTRASFADQLAEMLGEPGMSARIIDGSKDCQSSYAMAAGSQQKPQPFECHFGPDAPELQGVEGFMVIFPHDHMLEFEAYEQSSGDNSHALDGYALYDLGTRRLLGIIEECRLRVEYDYTAESRIVLLDPDGDSVDCAFSKP